MKMQRIKEIVLLRGSLSRALLLVAVISISIVGATTLASAEHGSGGGATYSFLDTDFTQDLVGTSNDFAGDLAWATDSDLFLSDCSGNGSNKHGSGCDILSTLHAF